MKKYLYLILFLIPSLANSSTGPLPILTTISAGATEEGSYASIEVAAIAISLGVEKIDNDDIDTTNIYAGFNAPCSMSYVDNPGNLFCNIYLGNGDENSFLKLGITAFVYKKVGIYTFYENYFDNDDLSSFNIGVSYMFGGF